MSVQKMSRYPRWDLSLFSLLLFVNARRLSRLGSYRGFVEKRGILIERRAERKLRATEG